MRLTITLSLIHIYGFLGNIEDFEWCEYFSDQVFDVIIFADVLEHLQDPLKVLEYSKKCLKSDGVFLVSFPNIGHNSVLIDLFNNNFSYNEYGLLDKTHNTFYTQDGFEKLFEKTGLYINEEDYTYAQVCLLYTSKRCTVLSFLMSYKILSKF